MLDSNDLTLGIRQAQTDISSYYVIGYYSTNSADDGNAGADGRDDVADPVHEIQERAFRLCPGLALNRYV